MQATLQGQSMESQTKAWGGMVSSVLSNESLSPKEMGEAIDRLVTMRKEMGARQGQGGGDLDGDGQVSPQETQYNTIATALKNKKRSDGRDFTPAELKALQLKQKDLARTLGLV